MVPDVLVAYSVLKNYLEGGKDEAGVIDAIKEGSIKGWISSETRYRLLAERGREAEKVLKYFQEIPLRADINRGLLSREDFSMGTLEVLSAGQFGLRAVVTREKSASTDVPCLTPDEFLGKLRSGEITRRERIPFMDLKAQLHTIYGELDSMFTDIITHNAFVAGDYVRKFEEEFAKYLGVRHVVTASSGTTALFMALLALGIGEGDEVITVPFTFVATLEAIVYTGATPVFVDIDPTTYNMDPAKLRKVITNRTRAIVPVHLYGQPADMNPILELAEKYDLKVIEDACQAHGALYRGKRAGAIGDAAAFSFYPGKNLGSWGEAGAVSTNNDQLAEKLRKLRDHGAEKKYFHLTRGLNLRTINFQGAVLSVKLKHLDSWNDRRREIAFLYNELLEDVKEVVTPYESTFVKHVYHLYVIRAERRDALRSFLSERGIDTGIHYPIPLHLQKAYEDLGYVRGDFPNAEEAALSVLSLPMFPELTDDEVERVAKTIKEFYS